MYIHVCIYVYILYVIYIYIYYICTYMAMYNLLGPPGEHNPARVFHKMQAHLHAWAPLGPCGPGPRGPLGLWAGPLWAPLGQCRPGP